MPVQAPADRFLMQDTATALYQPKAEKGQPNGLATLGADGKVPAGQLPPGATVFAAVKSADTTRVSTITATDDPHLTFANVPAGTYQVDAFLRKNTSGAGDLSVGLSFAATGYDGGLLMAVVPSNSYVWTTATWQMFGAATTVAASASNGFVLLSGGFYLPATQTKVALRWSQATNNTSPTTLLTGSSLRLSKIA